MRNETLYPTDNYLTRPSLPTPASAAPDNSGALIDQYGRKITYLRLSVTDRCDFRCVYCMSEDMVFLPRSEVLSLEEALRIVRCFVELGVFKVRITGGEPLVRRDILWLLENISALPGVRELVMTTNGSQLDHFAVPLVKAGVKRLNVSLDTLDPERFRKLTRIGELAKVKRGLAAARDAGFQRLKLNTVMIRGGNDDEFEALAEYALNEGFDISFIEEMPLGDIGHGRSSTWYSADEALARLVPVFGLSPTDETTGGPARYWRAAGFNSRIGFITPHSHNFCASCNRVRITARGDLYPCLGQNDAIPLMDALRAPENVDNDDALRAAIKHAMGIKPKEHDFTHQLDRPKVVRFMSMTGG
jgi:cyclic pyranopterin phosphate synthase